MKRSSFAGILGALLAARAAMSQADAAFYPRLSVGESYVASDNPVQAFMMTLNQRQFSFGMKVMF